ncbi:hypothetical protein N7U66_00360 [Lacinutrix neustonica]|uniref:Collagen-like protein n=1 Tax=Lacinutrix neustonica TaxID=2980107 RepID=A0A9E8SDM7_9FLAO|nr:hypothetical protein [Lacinutrix neustonica]WAC02271.1 hypothetical protein N7U66_00360 [Lacinutrix neustonica]
MNTLKQLLLLVLLFCSIGFLAMSCEDGKDGLNGQDGTDGQNGTDGSDGDDFTPSPLLFSNKSLLSPLVNIHSNFNSVTAYSLISSTDVLSNGFRLVGAQDGAGLLKDGDEYIYIVNAEDDYSVSEFVLMKT